MKLVKVLCCMLLFRFLAFVMISGILYECKRALCTTWVSQVEIRGNIMNFT